MGPPWEASGGQVGQRAPVVTCVGSQADMWPPTPCALPVDSVMGERSTNEWPGAAPRCLQHRFTECVLHSVTGCLRHNITECRQHNDNCTRSLLHGISSALD